MKNMILSSIFIGLMTVFVYPVHATPNSMVSSNMMEHHTKITHQRATKNARLSMMGRSNIIVSIKGMVCSFCAQGIQKTFESHASVKAVAVDLAQRTVALKLKRFRKISDAEIQTVIEDAGYNIGEIKRN
ncbi:MAG: heavy-metal-associated domain-containing protein [Candidatus Marinamargulisbacteria bacterium]